MPTTKEKRALREKNDRHADLPDPNIVFSFNEEAVRNGWLEK